jgi:hypothetical protein
MPYDFNWIFEPVAGSRLPELRFGRSYQLRIRVADMAGGGLEHGDQIGDRYASPEVAYRRHDPVPPPEMPPPPGVLVPDTRPEHHGDYVIDHAALGPGGSVERLVVRSDPAANLGPDAFAAYPPNNLRVLLPPPSSFALAEQHGMLDGNDERTLGWVRRATSPPTIDPDGRYSWLADPTAAGVALYVQPGPASPAPGQRDRQLWSGTWPDFTAKTLELRARPPHDEQTVFWDGESPHAIVDLAPSQQVTLEITSYPLPDDIDKLEIKHWLESGGSDDDTIRQGRHPMATPPRIVQLVHAVRKPMGTPSGTLIASRTHGDTSAVLHDPDPHNALLGVHPGSTAQVDLTAHWDEWHDDKGIPTGEIVVNSVPVELAAPTLPTLHHQFGDTRHRRITYTMTAISRFREYFTGEPEVFTASHQFDVTVPSTARPAPPVVLATTPAFRWYLEPAPLGTVRRTRGGGIVRVELARPWNLSGEGEQLAVLIWPGDAAVPEAARHLVTRIRRDPIWATPNPEGTADETMFDTEPATERAVTTPAEADHEIIAMRYTPQLVDDRWCVDVDLPGAATTSYCPFVQLAVARYQHESLEGLALSPVVRTELVQLFPERTVNAEITAQTVTVTLEGLGPAGPPNRVIAALERCTLPPGMLPGTVDLTATDAAVPDVPSWVRVPGQTTEGTLNTPLPPLLRPEGDASLRVVIREVEQLTPTNQEPAASNQIAAELTQRTVFIDVIPLSTQ